MEQYVRSNIQLFSACSVWLSTTLESVGILTQHVWLGSFWWLGSVEKERARTHTFILLEDKSNSLAPAPAGDADRKCGRLCFCCCGCCCGCCGCCCGCDCCCVREEADPKAHSRDSERARVAVPGIATTSLLVDVPTTLPLAPSAAQAAVAAGVAAATSCTAPPPPPVPPVPLPPAAALAAADGVRVLRLAR